jgi:hypothetical protein
MIVQTFTQKRGEVVGRTPPETPPEAARVFVRIWVTIPGQTERTVAIVARYHPSDVIEVRPT